MHSKSIHIKIIVLHIRIPDTNLTSEPVVHRPWWHSPTGGTLHILSNKNHEIVPYRLPQAENFSLEEYEIRPDNHDLLLLVVRDQRVFSQEVDECTDLPDRDLRV